MQHVDTTPLAPARIDDFALHTDEKLRYADTDRQGQAGVRIAALTMPSRKKGGSGAWTPSC
ncbi:MAG TPA: hypothetical protein PK752_15660 [Accumulibacter sp.]|uniref:hypothetical protein n=1 Tax=Accumulibacter sp. TaxID=2053492 RepID=UPI002C1B6028|nr:hypothetical protein [Accumulibacter sp.]HRD89675.1 hypothetical protein [Accumulibacter sp.]